MKFTLVFEYYKLYYNVLYVQHMNSHLRESYRGAIELQVIWQVQVIWTIYGL